MAATRRTPGWASGTNGVSAAPDTQPWSERSDCTCGGRQKTRNLHFLKTARDGGKACEPSDKEPVSQRNTDKFPDAQEWEDGEWHDGNP